MIAWVASAVAADPALRGDWAGAIEVGATSVPVVVHVSPTGVTFDSPDQGAFGLVASNVVVTEVALAFELPVAHARFDAIVADDRLSGTWSQGGASLPLVLSRATPPNRPQDPGDPLPYTVVDVTFPSVDGVTLAGTLTRPPGEARVPAVVLVSGSGPQDRDETLFGHRPFRLLADALTRRGFAVLRYDDRGTARSTGDFATATTRDFAADARAAVRFLADRPDVDGQRIAILGHSEGGLVAPMVANAGGVAAVVLIGGPGLPGRDVVEGQVDALARAAGATREQAEAARATQHTILGMVVDGASEADLRRHLESLGLPDARAQAAALASPWYREFLVTDPRPELRALRVPVLAIVGGRDLQVVASENIPALRDALAANPDAAVLELSGLNHLLQPAMTGAPDEYATIETTIYPTALDEITSWLDARL